MRNRWQLGAAGPLIASLLLQGCLMKTPPPPTIGYGPPYKGTGESIFIKDSRTDWTISEGNRPITPEQALEVSGDEEYETRRQIMKAHNEALHRAGKKHRRTAKILIFSGIGLIAAGWIGGTIMAFATKSETITAPTAMDPSMRVVEPSTTSNLFSLLGLLGVSAGVVGVGYGLYGSLLKPPYVQWRVPYEMNRPAYIRQQVEPYNEKLTPAHPIPTRRPDAPSLPGTRPAPGTRPPPTMPAPPPGSGSHRSKGPTFKRPRGGR